MNTLTFDVEAAKEQLTQVFRDRIAAQGSVYNVLNVSLEDLSFSDQQKQIPNQSQLIAEMQNDLQKAQTNSQRWFNEVQPQLTVIPQAAINYATLWNSTIPLVLKQLSLSTPDRNQLQELFSGLKSSIGKQTVSLTGLLSTLENIRAAIATDATNFSNKHATFQQLEDLDKEDLANARATLDKIKLMIDQFNQDIEVDTIKAEKDLALASNAMKYGKKFGDIGKILGLTIGLIFIVSATFAIDDLLSAIDQRLADAEKAGEIELEMTLLTTQLISLETASSALSSTVSELDDLIASLQATIDGWKTDSSEISAVISGLQEGQPINSILNQFDMGRTQGQWDELRIFATKWQTMEVSPKATNELLLDAGGN